MSESFTAVSFGHGRLQPLLRQVGLCMCVVVVVVVVGSAVVVVEVVELVLVVVVVSNVVVVVVVVAETYVPHFDSVAFSSA